MSSTLFLRLQNFTLPDVIKVMCLGQNKKNSIVLTAMYMWLLNYVLKQQESVDLMFSIPGVFIPAYRSAFSYNNQKNKNEKIILPEEYRNIIGDQGKVLQ